MDADNFILSRSQFNFIDLFDSEKVQFSTTNLWYAADSKEVSQGLPEFTRYDYHAHNG